MRSDPLPAALAEALGEIRWATAEVERSARARDAGALERAIERRQAAITRLRAVLGRRETAGFAPQRDERLVEVARELETQASAAREVLEQALALLRGELASLATSSRALRAYGAASSGSPALDQQR